MGIDLKDLKTKRIEEFLPHSHGMLFVDEMLEFNPDDNSNCCLARMETPKACLSKDGEVATPWYIELMSQGVGVLYQQIKSLQGKKLDVGFLVSIQSFEVHSHQIIKEGDKVLINSRLEEEFDPFGYFQCEMKLKGGQLIANARMSFVVQNV